MNLQRIAAGEYIIQNGGRLVRLTKSLTGDWDITPESGVNLEPRKAESYADAKLIGQWMVRKAAEETPAINPKAVAAHIETARNAKAALMRAEGGEVEALKLKMHNLLKKMADEFLA